jgi:hypothetical protein
LQLIFRKAQFTPLLGILILSQVINKDKSSTMFSPNTTDNLKDEMRGIVHNATGQK